MAAGAYFLGFVRFYSHYAPVRSFLRPTYRLGQGLLQLAVVGAGWKHLETAAAGWVLLASLAFGYATYNKTRVELLVLNSQVKHRPESWLVEVHVSHCFAALSYLLLLARITDNAFGIALTVALIIHGIVLLAQLLVPRFTGLRSLAGLVFLSALGKLFLLDLKGTSTVQKTLAFIALGAICLGAAYGFQKLAKKTTPSGEE